MVADRTTSKGKLIVFSAPSGTGKSTIAKAVLERVPGLRFSVSGTTRAMRPGEVDGVNYHFLSKEEFEQRIADGGFIEHEFFFGNYYGTLLDKTREVIESGGHLLLDLDVKGAVNLKGLFPEESLLVFLQPPDMDTLRERLRKRDSESEEDLRIRLERAELEMGYADRFDVVFVNDKLDETIDAVTAAITTFISKP